MVTARASTAKARSPSDAVAVRIGAVEPGEVVTIVLQKSLVLRQTGRATCRAERAP